MARERLSRQRGKYSNYSVYCYTLNNPVKFVDPNGEDVVYFDINGNEIHRQKTSLINAVLVANSNGSYDFAPMPKIIPTKGGTDTSGAIYQKLDYYIAADTYIFNRNKNNGIAKIFDGNGNAVSSDNFNQIDDLDPTLVKATVMQETTMGTLQGGKRNGTLDIMQSNVYITESSNDWADFKTKLGLKKDASADKRLSLFAGIRLMAGKGFTSVPTYESDGTISRKFTFHGWDEAANKYNGGGAKKHGLEYEVMKLFNSAIESKPSDYKKHYGN